MASRKVLLTGDVDGRLKTLFKRVEQASGGGGVAGAATSDIECHWGGRGVCLRRAAASPSPLSPFATPSPLCRRHRGCREP